MKTLLLTTAFLVVAGGAHAASVSIDFETGYTDDVTVLANGTEIAPGVTVSSTEEPIQVVKTGEPRDGFVPDDMPADDSFGDFFLTGDFDNDTDLTLSFATDVSSLSFDIADIDGSGKEATNSTEYFSFIAYLDGSIVEEIFVDATEVSGDAQVVNIAFATTTFLDTLEIIGVTEGGSRNIGWGIDNIHASPVPLPAAGWLLIGAFGGLVAMKRRKTAA